MNRNLLLFSLFLIVLGIGFDFYLLSLFGFLIMIPAFMSPSRVPPRPGTGVPREERRRINPPLRPQATPTPPPEAISYDAIMSKVEIPSQPRAMSSSYQSYSPALFPTSMFPSLSLMGNPPPAVQPEQKKASERDELVETGAMLALLRLLMG